MIAYLRHEPGWNVVADLLRDTANACVAHAVNLSEVFRYFRASSDQATARAAISTLFTDGVLAREDMEQPFWEDIAEMIVLARATPGLTLPIADAFGIAMARRLGCELVSSDHKDLDPLLPLGLCAVRFIR
jgi:predicted nucleic acid-binding protein